MGKPLRIEKEMAEKTEERKALVDRMSSHESELKDLEARLKELDILYEKEKTALQISAAKQPAAPGDTIAELKDQIAALRRETEGLKAQPPVQDEDAAGGKRVQELEARLAEKDKLLSEEKKKWLAREQELKAEFVSMIEDLARGFSHRVRNYLGTISGTAQLCLARHKLEDNTREQLQIIDQSVGEMLETTEEFLKMTKAREMLYEQIDLSGMLEGLLASMQPVLDTQSVEVHTDFDADAPRISGVAKLIEEALRNILQNAVEAMASGGCLEVSVRCDRAARRVLAVVSDTGTGIGEQHLKKVFQPYFTSKKQHKGNGLTIARMNIGVHGGCLTLESTKGKGTKIRVFFPL